MRAALFAGIVLAASARAQVAAPQVVTSQIPFYLPTTLLGPDPPTAVSQVGTPSQSAASTTYVLSWASSAFSQPITVTSNSVTIVATQTGPGLTTAWNCQLQSAPAAQAVCTDVDEILNESNVVTEDLTPFTTVALVISGSGASSSSASSSSPTTSSTTPLIAATTTTTTSPTTTSQQTSTTALSTVSVTSTPSTTGASLASATTQQTLSANVFGNGAGRSFSWTPLLLLVLATFGAAVLL